MRGPWVAVGEICLALVCDALARPDNGDDPADNGEAESDANGVPPRHLGPPLGKPENDPRNPVAKGEKANTGEYGEDDCHALTAKGAGDGALLGAAARNGAGEVAPCLEMGC